MQADNRVLLICNQSASCSAYTLVSQFAFRNRCSYVHCLAHRAVEQIWLQLGSKARNLLTAFKQLRAKCNDQIIAFQSGEMCEVWNKTKRMTCCEGRSSLPLNSFVNLVFCKLTQVWGPQWSNALTGRAALRRLLPFQLYSIILPPAAWYEFDLRSCQWPLLMNNPAQERGEHVRREFVTLQAAEWLKSLQNGWCWANRRSWSGCDQPKDGLMAVFSEGIPRSYFREFSNLKHLEVT